MLKFQIAYFSEGGSTGRVAEAVAAGLCRAAWQVIFRIEASRPQSSFSFAAGFNLYPGGMSYE